MRTRKSKGRNGEVYPLVTGGHGLCVKRSPLYISAEQITQWWLDSNRLTNYKDIATYISVTPLSKAGLLRDLNRFYTCDDPNLVHKGHYHLALDMINQVLGFPRLEEE